MSVVHLYTLLSLLIIRILARNFIKNILAFIIIGSEFVGINRI